MTRRALDAQSVHLSAGATAQGAYTMASSPETAVAWTKAMAGEELEGRELAIYQMSVQAALVSLDGALSARALTHTGIAADPIDDVWDKAVRAYVATPSFQKIWTSGYLQDSLTDLTTEFVQNRVSSAMS